jgi:hypothetical protein
MEQSLKGKEMADNHFPEITCLFVSCAVGVILGVANPGFCQGDENLAVEMSVKYIGGPNRTIEITLLNNDNKTIECLEACLPWRHRYSMTLVLVKTDATKEQLKTGVPPIDDPSPMVIELPPKKTLKGNIDLKDLYPGIDNTLASSGVDVFYAYQFSSLDNRSAKRVGGWFSIPQAARK